MLQKQTQRLQTTQAVKNNNKCQVMSYYIFTLAQTLYAYLEKIVVSEDTQVIKLIRNGKTGFKRRLVQVVGHRHKTFSNK